MSAGVDELRRGAEAAEPPPSLVAPPRTVAGRWRAATARLRPRWLTDDVVRGLRWGSVGIWLILFAAECVQHGVPFDREGLLLWIATGAGAVSIGRRSVIAVMLDFLPLALVLIAYDYLRGLSYQLGMPTWWHPQIDVDRGLFAGVEPTVWLQEHLKHPAAQWYDVAVTVCYYSFFFLPYVTAGVMWLRSRRDFYRWTLRFVALSFLAFGLFALIPAAPPWAAAHCTAAEVASHPNDPSCMYLPGQSVPSGGMLGPMTSHLDGANPWIERLAGRGFADLHLDVANALLDKGRGIADPVAAVPSLHLGGTLLFVLFMWARLRRAWRPLLVAYPLVMTFTLVYSAEHYVADCLAGTFAAVGLHLVANRIEARRTCTRAPDTLETPPVTNLESSCPPSRPLSETTPSST